VAWFVLPKSLGSFGHVWPVVLAVLLWLLIALTDGSPVLGVGLAHEGIVAAAVTATAVTAVLGVSWLILHFFDASSDEGTTGLHRVLVHGAVGLAVAGGVLSYFGFDLRALLTASAVATIAVGIAVQPTLSSMFAGMTLSGSGVVRVGDGIVRGNRAMRVESMSWRTVVARGPNGILLMIPNARLADQEIEILPHDRPVRAETVVKFPSSVPPAVVAAFAADLIPDSPLVDDTRPVTAEPMDWEAGSTMTSYRLRYWVAHYWDMSAAETDVLRRFWYGFHRHRIASAHAAALPLPGYAPPDIAPLIRACLPDTPHDQSEHLARIGTCLLFAPGERLALPDWAEGWCFTMLRGTAESHIGIRLTDDRLDPDAAHDRRRGRVAALQGVTSALAKQIGPFAGYAVARAARRTHDLDALCRTVAMEISDLTDRTAFLDAMVPETAGKFQPGHQFIGHRDATGRLVSDRSLQARDEVLVLAIPPASQVQPPP
jgi:hypothetical protein